MRPILHDVLPSGPSFGLKGKVSAIAAQPMALSVATALNQNAVAAYLDNYHVIEGRVRYNLRERLKLEKAIYRIKWVPVEEPGVIPKILDNVNATVVESTAVLSNVNRSLGSVQGVIDFLAKYSTYIKIGLAVAAGLILLILLMGLIVLFRLAFGI